MKFRTNTCFEFENVQSQAAFHEFTQKVIIIKEIYTANQNIKNFKAT